MSMKIACGKVEDLVQNSSSGSGVKLPITSVAFKPRPPRGQSAGTEQLLTAGNSSVVLWRLTIFDPAPPTESVESKPNLTADTARTAAQNVSSEAKWLHAEPLAKRVSGERILSIADHAPGYVVRVAWSPDGRRFATADGHQVFVWAEKEPDQYHRQATMVEAAVGEIFDFCWLSPSLIAIGGISKVVFKAVVQSASDLVVPPLIELPESAICKGLAARTTANGDVILSISTNLKTSLVYRIKDDQPPSLLFEDRSLFQAGPSDVPLLRHTTLDPSGQLVAFSYGERRGEAFGVIIDLSDIARAQTETDTEKAEALRRDAEYRVRGHQTRVSCVAFSNCTRPMAIAPEKFVQGDEQTSGSDLRNLVREVIAKASPTIVKSELWPHYTRYAQASVDGCLSIWDVYTSQNGNPLSAVCLMATPTSIVDQTGLISDLSWSANDNILAVASDDGKLTCIIFDEEETRSVSTYAESKWLGRGGDNCVEPRKSIKESMILHAESKQKSPAKKQNVATMNGSAESGIMSDSPFVLITPNAYQTTRAGPEG